LRLTLSRRKHLPVFAIEGYTYAPWQLAKALRANKIMKTVKSFSLDFPRTYKMIYHEWETWKVAYSPPKALSRDSLVLDVGAGEGETVLFYFLLGFRRFRAVESNRRFVKALEANCRALGVEAEIFDRPFTLSDLEGVDYVKMDCEGCESEILRAEAPTLDLPFAIETHSPELEAQLIAKYPAAKLAVEWEDGVKIFKVNHDV
jgi:hypothetical protein